MDFEWHFEEEDFAEAQNSTLEDEIYGSVSVKSAKETYLVDIHKEYYNAKDCGYDLEVFHENVDGTHGVWIGNVNSIRSISAMCDPLGKFKKRAEKLLTDFIDSEEKAA